MVHRMPRKNNAHRGQDSSPAPRERGNRSRKRAVGQSPSPGSPGSSPGSPLSPPAELPGREREEAATRCGFVALIGAPNAGKSTLLNQLVGHKLAIVTPKVQTTRTRLLGIAIEGPAQLIFVDTPGIFAPRRRLDRAMVAAAWAGAADADATVLLVDAARAAQRGIDRDTKHILDRLAPSLALPRSRGREGWGQTGRRAILALNKIDL